MARTEVWGGQIAVDDRFVYWTEGSGRLMRAERPDGAPAVLDNPFEGMPGFFQLQFGMVASAGTVHYTAVTESQQIIFQTNPDGVSTRRLLGCFGPRLAADGDLVFAPSCSDPSLFVLRPDGTQTLVNLPGIPRGIVAGGGGAQTAVGGGSECCDLRSFTPDGMSTLIAPQTLAFPIARHGDTIFLAEGSVLSAVPVTGGTPTKVAQLPGQIETGSGAADETHVFVKVSAAGGSQNDLFAVRRSGGEPKFLATLNVPADIVAAEEGVYWSTFGAPPTGGVFRLDRCAYD
jgi:hypothetical protein